VDFPKKKNQWAAGDEIVFASGPYSGEKGTIKEFDILGLENIGWRCSVELTTGSNKGKLVSAYTGQLKQLESERVPARKNTILVVEDDPDTQYLLCSLLRAEGYEAIATGDGGEAMKFLETNRPDLILTDLMMPHVSGLELLDFVKHQPVYADIPVIVITAYDKNNSDKATKAGALKVLDKPSAIGDIADTISKVIH